MNYSLATLMHERQRYLPGVLAVTFSAVLIALQCGLLLGLFSITSIPIDRSRADVWVSAPGVLSVDLGRRIPESYVNRFPGAPEVTQVEEFIESFAAWIKPDPDGMGREAGSELCIVLGARLDDDAIGYVNDLTPELRDQLREHGSIVLDKSEFERLGIPKGIDSLAQINGHQVRVVGSISGYKSLAGPYVFCSLDTARTLLGYAADHTVYLLAKCRSKADAPAVVAALSGTDDFAAFTAENFSFKSRWHWLTKTRAGGALGYAALLGLLVGAVVVQQTLAAATAASMKEYATLMALGIPRWRLASAVLTQSFWVGLAGVILAWPVVEGVGRLIDRVGGIPVQSPWWLLVSAGVVTLVTALLSGLFSLRGLRQIEPVNLLR